MTKTVVATKAGTYGHYREPGAVFDLDKDEHFSKRWMAEMSTPEAIQARQAAEAKPSPNVVTSSVVDNAVMEALKAQLAERDAEIERLKRGIKPGKEASDEQPKTAAEVLAMGSDPSVQFMTFKSAATKVLGDATPSTKAEIIAALEDKATQP